MSYGTDYKVKEKTEPKEWPPIGKGWRKARRTSGKWCACGYKVGGPNHEDGQHHKDAEERAKPSK